MNLLHSDSRPKTEFGAHVKKWLSRCDTESEQIQEVGSEEGKFQRTAISEESESLKKKIRGGVTEEAKWGILCPFDKHLGKILQDSEEALMVLIKTTLGMS